MKQTLYGLGLAVLPLKQSLGTVVKTPTPAEMANELTSLDFSTMKSESGTFPNLYKIHLQLQQLPRSEVFFFFILHHGDACLV